MTKIVSPTPSRRRRKSSRTFELSLKKRPTQTRAEQTFEAIVTAAARLLASHGYAEVTTNHIAVAAGVSIGSLYEYFPGKDAIVAQVAERLIDRVVRRLTAAFADVLDGDPETAMRRWITIIYATLLRERKLVEVFVAEVPFTRQLECTRAITPRLFALSRALQTHARVSLEDESASLYLIINLVSSTILQLVLEPPNDVTAEQMLDALSARVASWVSPHERGREALKPSSFGSGRARGGGARVGEDPPR